MDAHESSPGFGGQFAYPRAKMPEQGDAKAEVGSPSSGDPVMENLPKSRPQRQERVRRRPSASPRKPSRKAASTKAAQTRATPTIETPIEGAPGLPRLALDGAIEAAKLPVKVGAKITFRALEAVADALRRR